MMDSHALVIGAGSIGLRHRRVLEQIGFRAEMVSRRPDVNGSEGVKCHADLATALGDLNPEYVIIATETTTHLAALKWLASWNYRGSVLVEKPISESSRDLDLRDLPFRALAVGYQLRFHPAVGAGRAALGGAQPLAFEASVGQHLSFWRPGRSIGDTASARVEAGGGVLRDLSHELDLVLWLGGNWRRVCALGGRSGGLGPTVATDDRWGILLELESGTVATISLDALDRVRRRRLSIVAADRTVVVDLITETVVHSGLEGRAAQQYSLGRDEVLEDMHRAFLNNSHDDRLCRLDQGIEVVRLIDAIERSVNSSEWVERGPVR